MNGPFELMVVVADNRQEDVVRNLLDKRRDSLKIRPASYEVLRPGTDGTVRKTAHKFLKQHRHPECHALVMLDCVFDDDKYYPPQALREEIRLNLMKDGWTGENCEVIAIDPEIEMWVWITNSPQIETALGVKWDEIYSIARNQQPSLWPEGQLKPTIANS